MHQLFTGVHKTGRRVTKRNPTFLNTITLRNCYEHTLYYLMGFNNKTYLRNSYQMGYVLSQRGGCIGRL